MGILDSATAHVHYSAENTYAALKDDVAQSSCIDRDGKSDDLLMGLQDHTYSELNVADLNIAEDEWAMRRVPLDDHAEEDSLRCHGCNKDTLDCHGVHPKTGQRCGVALLRGTFYPSIRVLYCGIKPEDLHKPNPPMETIPVMAYFCSMDCVNSVAAPSPTEEGGAA